MAKAPLCKFCGQAGFVWTNTPRGWRLTDPVTGSVHTCRGKTGSPILPPPVTVDLASIATHLDEIEERDTPKAPPSILSQLLDAL